MELSAGFAEIDITPPIGTWMGGYAFRSTGCTAIHDPLFARAAVFENAGKAIAILSMDLIGLDDRVVVAVRTGIEKETGIPAAVVMLNASHTHGGPLTKSFRAMGPKNPAYTGWLTRQLIEVTKRAANGQTYPNQVLFGRAPVRIGVNRRQYGENPEDTHIGVNPAGPVMNRVDVIAVKNWRRSVSAVLFSHACHPTTLGGSNLAITADYIGYACATIRRALGPEVIPLFLQGCCGNINPHPRGDFGCAKKHGEALGRAVLTAIKHAEPLDGERVDYAVETLDLDQEPPPPLEECEQEVVRWEEEAARWRAEGDVGQLLNAEGMRDQAVMECEAETLGDDEWFSDVIEVQRLTLGPIQLLGFPAEMFVQYALDFDRQAAGPVLTLGCTNGVHGYIPVAADFPFGGYEVHGAHRYYATLPYAANCERYIRRAAYELLGIAQPDFTPNGI